MSEIKNFNELIKLIKKEIDPNIKEMYNNKFSFKAKDGINYSIVEYKRTMQLSDLDYGKKFPKGFSVHFEKNYNKMNEFIKNKGEK